MKKLIKLISAGWGSSGYYSAEMLQRDGATAFPAGTKMLNSHVNNNPNSPARKGQGVSGDDLVAKTLQDAYYAESPDGSGLYAECEFYPDFVERWSEEKINDMEFSIFTGAEWSSPETIDGRRGRRALRLFNSRLTTVDAVVFGGAGGRVVMAQESALIDGDGHITVYAVEAPSASTRISAIRRNFNKQFDGDGHYYYIRDYFDLDDYIIVDNGGLSYRVDYVISDDEMTIVFDERENWVEVIPQMIYLDAQTGANVATENGDIDMNLQEALAENQKLNTAIEKLKSDMATGAKEVAAVTAERNELRYRINAIETAKMAAAAVNSVIGEVKFIDNEARQLVVESLKGSVKITDGKVDMEALATAAESYTSGKSGLVVAAESDGKDWLNWPSTGNGRDVDGAAEAVSVFDDYLKPAANFQY